MKKCKFEDLIDGYLLNRLSEQDKEAFEEHYFNCSSCFEQLQEKDIIIRTIKNNPDLLEEKEPARASVIANLRREVASFFTPKQLALAGVVAALFVVIIFSVVPQPQAPAPVFFLTDEEAIRGSSITLISPVIDMNQIPASFEWKKLGEDIEYQVAIYNSELLWKANTKENRITLPDEIKAKMIPGEKYSWQVKAFGSDGSLIAVSSRVQFKIAAQ
jgi:hypothetical protein